MGITRGWEGRHEKQQYWQGWLTRTGALFVLASQSAEGWRKGASYSPALGNERKYAMIARASSRFM